MTIDGRSEYRIGYDAGLNQALELLKTDEALRGVGHAGIALAIRMCRSVELGNGMMRTTEEQLHLARHALLAIHDLASARLRNPPLESNVEYDLTQIVSIADGAMATLPNGDPQVKP